MDDFKTKPIPDPVVPPTESSEETVAKKSVRRTSKKAPIFESKSVPDPVSIQEDLAVGQGVSATVEPVTNAEPAPQPIAPFTPENPHRFKNFVRNNKWYIVAMGVGLVIIGVLAFIAFRPQKQEPTKKANVSLSFDAPEIAPASGDVIYKIRIKNNDSVKLVNMQLELLYPDGLSYISSTPKADNLSGSLFNIPDLPPGTDIPVVLKVSSQGDVNSELKLIAQLNYKYDQFNSLFTEESSHTIRLTASDVILDFTGSNNISGSQTASYQIDYRNNSDKDIPNARIVLSYPNGFVFGSSNPSPTMGQNTWDIGTLKNQEGGKINITGNFKGVSEGSGYLFEATFQSQDSNGNYNAQSVTRHETSISTQPLSVDHAVLSGSTGTIVSPGDEISYQVNFRNNTNIVATGVNVEAEIISPVVSTSSIRAENGAVRGNTVIWNASSLPLLANLGPSADGSLKFSLSVNNPAIDGNNTNLSVITKVRIVSNEQREALPGNEITLKINSPASLSGSVSHVGGPLPLKVGQQSVFQVTLEVRNSSNDLQKAILAAVVPIGVELDLSGVSADDLKTIKYEKATGRFVWDAGVVPAHSGRSRPARKISFKTLITPAANQVNDSPILLKGITLNAKDSFTNQNVSLRAEDISTGNLPGEDGLGRVEP